MNFFLTGPRIKDSCSMDNARNISSFPLYPNPPSFAPGPDSDVRTALPPEDKNPHLSEKPCIDLDKDAPPSYAAG
jgi:hypothetical protein